MQKLTVLYDATCGLCFEVKSWITGRATYIDLEFIAAGGPAANSRFPALPQQGELIAIDDRGGVYRDDRAWLMIMWAMRDYRALAERLASPTLRPLARRAWRFISDGRRSISALLSLSSEPELAATLRTVDPPISCAPHASMNS